MCLFDKWNINSKIKCIFVLRFNMELKRSTLPAYFIPLFMVWVALCNISVIILSIVFFKKNINFVGIIELSAGVDLGIILGINILSLILLYPLFKMDPITPFFIPALIWFVLVTATYVLFGMYILLIFGVVQLGADIWFEVKYRKLLKNQNSKDQ